jgi:predicted methyltransferase
VLTFRNAHNWVNPAYGAHSGPLSFKVMFDALKPGGILGLVDHRWPDAKPKTQRRKMVMSQRSVLLRWQKPPVLNWPHALT